MLRNLISLLILITLSGCATTETTCVVPLAQGKEAATIIVYRPSAFYGMAYAPSFTVDNCSIGKLTNGSFKTFSLPAGEHRLATEKRAFVAGGDVVFEDNFEAGKTYYLRYSLRSVEFKPMPGIGILTSSSTHLFQTTKEDALEAMPELPK